MFIVIKDMKGGYASPYLGAITKVAGNPWYVTGRAGPTIYEKEEEATLDCVEYQGKWPHYDYKVISLKEYSESLKKDGRLTNNSHQRYSGGQCEWIQELLKKVSG